MTDRQMLDELLGMYHANIRVTASMLDAILMFERGVEESCWYCLLRWCEAKDEREEYWGRFKHHYPDAIALKEGVSYDQY